MEVAPNPLPDESLLQLPASWKAGRLRSRRALPSAGATELWRAELQQHRSRIDLAIEIPENAEFAKAMQAYLDGEPDPLGAAAISMILHDRSRRETLEGSTIDAWELEHGLPFAAAAVVEEAGLAYEEHWPFRKSPRWRESTGLLKRAVRGGVVGDWEYRVTERLRGAIEACEPAVYSEVRAAVASRLHGQALLERASLLFPAEDQWIADACAGYIRYQGATDGGLWPLIRTTDQLEALDGIALYPREIGAAKLGALMARLGVDCLPALVATLDNGWEPDTKGRQAVLAAIAMLPSDAAVSFLLDRISDRFVLAAACAAARRFPVRMMRAAAARDPVADPAGREYLAAVLSEVPQEWFDPAFAQLGESDQARIKGLVNDPDALPDAAAESLPALLVAPPWLADTPKSSPTVIRGLRVEDDPKLEWAQGEKQRFAECAAESEPRGIVPRWDLMAEHVSQRYRSDYVCQMLAYGPSEFADPLLERWTGELKAHSREEARSFIHAMLLRYGSAVADRIVEYIAETGREGDCLGPIVSIAAARAAAHWLANLKVQRAEGAAWLDRHGATGAILLVPDAVGGEKKRRTAAVTALIHIAERQGAQTVIDAAGHYGEQVAAAIRVVLEQGPVETRPAKKPGIGAWVNPRLLPQVAIKDRTAALPRTSVLHLVSILSIAELDTADRGVEVLAETCDLESLRAFSWKLFEHWDSAGAPAKDRWALDQLCWFGDDETVCRLALLIHEWPGLNRHHHAVAALQVLGRIGSESALLAMQNVALRAKFKAIKAEAGKQIEVIAARLGLTREQLADRLVPDFGLGEDGALVLEYGPRRFRVLFDEQLEPYVTDEDGNRRKSLPKPGAKDDPEVAEAAYKRFGDLKKELRAVARDQIRRLEAAMVNARSWNREEFERFFVRHPLMRHLAKRMIWHAETADGRIGFRFAEDGTSSNANDDKIELPESAVFSLAHPIHMEPKERDAWGQILADYEILQPFEQLSRPILAFTEEELSTGRLTRFEGLNVEPGHLLGLTNRGWVRGKPQDNGTEFGMHYPLPGGGYVAIELDPGLQIGMGASYNETQRLDTVFLTDEIDDYYRRRGGHPTEIDLVASSEVLATLERLPTVD
ncbi:DUF4132 domain-containing protein [Nocardia carnea]|uniref:DUF4132 domain-containing protein n=1 Tax=Nocardia carnea TaxID=37328 RepID=UPI0024548C75|nr:DUF4132 domain-containing protein [Nocardia carnea]